MGTAQSTTLGYFDTTRKQQSCHNLVIRNWNPAAGRGKATTWLSKPNGIAWMLLTSFRLSAVDPRLWSWTKGQNYSGVEPTMSTQAEETQALTWHAAQMNISQ